MLFIYKWLNEFCKDSSTFLKVKTLVFHGLCMYRGAELVKTSNWLTDAKPHTSKA